MRKICTCSEHVCLLSYSCIKVARYLCFQTKGTRIAVLCFWAKSRLKCCYVYTQVFKQWPDIKQAPMLLLRLKALERIGFQGETLVLFCLLIAELMLPTFDPHIVLLKGCI